MIKLDINIGDIILVGRFKNKRIEVKEFGIDEHGLPTINGRSILKIRVEKLMKTKKNLKMGESKQLSLANIVKNILKEMRDMDDEYLEMAENIADEYKDFIDKRSIEHEQTDDEGSYTLEFTMVIPISHDDYYSVEDAEEGYQERFNDGPGVEGNPGGQVIHVNVSDVSKEGKNWAVTLYVRGGYDI